MSYSGLALRIAPLQPAKVHSTHHFDSNRLSRHAAVFAFFLQCALPFAVAVFPQKGAIAAAKLEPQFQGKVDATTGKQIETFYYNKGI